MNMNNELSVYTMSVQGTKSRDEKGNKVWKKKCYIFAIQHDLSTYLCIFPEANVFIVKGVPQKRVP